MDYTKSVQENAARYYEESKRLRKKAEGARKAVEETERRLRELEKEIAAEKQRKEQAKPKVKREREWFEKFRWFRASDGRLVIAGRDARQNDLLYAKYLEPNDLFFHADVHGAPVTILKDGQKAEHKILLEAAQFAASHSNAWKEGMAVCDVYALRPEQVSKTPPAGEFIAKGAFVLKGEREWFRSTELGLLVGLTETGLESAPLLCGRGRFKVAVEIRPGNMEKGEAARRIAERLGGGISLDELIQHLPPGKSSVK